MIAKETGAAAGEEYLSPKLTGLWSDSCVIRKIKIETVYDTEGSIEAATR